jgi:hypothetical protein
LATKLKKTAVLAKAILSLCVFFTVGLPAALADRSAFDLIGHWQGVAVIGKTKVVIILHVDKAADGKIATRLDVPDQATKDLPVAALLYNHPAVRLEIDQIAADFNGKLNDAGTEISGAFEQGPGGISIPVVFKRQVGTGDPEPKHPTASALGNSGSHSAKLVGRVGPSTAVWASQIIQSSTRIHGGRGTDSPYQHK